MGVPPAHKPKLPLDRGGLGVKIENERLRLACQSLSGPQMCTLVSGDGQPAWASTTANVHIGGPDFSTQLPIPGGDELRTARTSRAWAPA